MTPKTETISVQICIDCEVVPKAAATGGLSCPICKKKARDLETWNEENRFFVESDIPEKLLHFDYGLQPLAVEILLLMLESSRETCRRLTAAGIENITQDDLDSLTAYVIGNLATRPLPEKIRVGKKTILLV